MVFPTPQDSQVIFSPTPAKYDSPGVDHASGSGGSFTDTWFIEHQQLEIYYMRVPYAYLVSASFGLSSVTAAHNITQTHLVAQVRATHRATSSVGTYNTSAYYQPQTFDVHPLSSDIYGNTYGNLDSSNMGPMGIITTRQPYYSRTPYVASSHFGLLNPNTPPLNAITVAAYKFITLSSLSGVQTYNPIPFYADFKYSIIPSWNPGTFVSDQEVRVWAPQVYNGMYGAYSVASEPPNQFSNFIDAIGGSIAGSWLFAIPANTTGPFPVLDQGIPQYDVNKHSYV